MSYLKDDFGLICICNECERVFEPNEMTLERFTEQKGYCDECHSFHEDITLDNPKEFGLRA